MDAEPQGSNSHRFINGYRFHNEVFMRSFLTADHCSTVECGLIAKIVGKKQV